MHLLCDPAFRSAGLACLLLVVLVIVLAIMLTMRTGEPLPDYAEYVGGGAPPQTTTLNVQEPWISYIAGKGGLFKTVEGRPCPAEKWRPRISEPITFENAGRKVDALITAVRHYDTLKEFLDAEWRRTAPQAETREEAEALYMGVRMKSRDPARDGAPAGAEVQVFSPARIAARGGMTAIEFVLKKPCDGLAWLAQELQSPVEANRKDAEAAFGSINSFLGKFFPQDAQRMTKIIKQRGRAGWRDGRIMAELKTISDRLKARILKKDEARKKGRARSRQADLEKDLKKYAGTVDRYLDIGCAEGDLTEVIADLLKVPPEGTYGCDLSAEAPENFSEGATYLQASVEALPFPDDHFGAVSCIMSLHHFPDVPRALIEIRRVLKPGGLMIIREHDSNSPAFAVFLDFVHYVYTILLKDEISIRPCCSDSDLENQQLRVVGKYRTAQEWGVAINSAGFEDAGVSGDKKFKAKKDRFRSFYAFYRAK